MEIRVSQQIQIRFEMGTTSGPAGPLCMCVYQREGGGRPREERRGPPGGVCVCGQHRARPGRGDLRSRERCFYGALADDSNISACYLLQSAGCWHTLALLVLTTTL